MSVNLSARAYYIIIAETNAPTVSTVYIFSNVDLARVHYIDQQNHKCIIYILNLINIAIQDMEREL